MGGEGMILTIEDVAKRWKVDRRTVRKEIEKGKLKYFVIGGSKKPTYRIREEWVREFEEREIS